MSVNDEVRKRIMTAIQQLATAFNQQDREQYDTLREARRLVNEAADWAAVAGSNWQETTESLDQIIERKEKKRNR